MPKFISDEVLNQYACVGTYDEITDILARRYKDVVTHCEFSIPVSTAEDHKTLREMVVALRSTKPQR